MPQLKRRTGRPSGTLRLAVLIADVEVWRAATQVDLGDLRPTGPPRLGGAARLPAATRLAAPDINANRQMAAATGHRSPQRHRGPIPAGSRRS